MTLIGERKNANSALMFSFYLPLAGSETFSEGSEEMEMSEELSESETEEDGLQRYSLFYSRFWL